MTYNMSASLSEPLTKRRKVLGVQEVDEDDKCLEAKKSSSSPSSGVTPFRVPLTAAEKKRRKEREVSELLMRWNHSVTTLLEDLTITKTPDCHS